MAVWQMEIGHFWPSVRSDMVYAWTKIMLEWNEFKMENMSYFSPSEWKTF